MTDVDDNATLDIENQRSARFFIQLHHRNINFIKADDDDLIVRDEAMPMEYFKNGKLHTRPGEMKKEEDSKTPFKNAVALIQTLQGSDANGIDMLPNAKRNQQFKKMAGGLQNPGINICFMNVILQVLTHSPYLAPALMRSAHARVCPSAKRKMVCVTCVLETHVKKALSSSVSLKNPFVHLVQKLIWKQYQIGRQEDAFIFLKHFLEALIKGCYGSKYPYSSVLAMPQKDVMQSFIGRIFGGFLLNVVICSKCNYRSEKLETCFDISVDIYRANKLIDLLSSFVKEEILDSNNKYNCPVCKRHQRATKAMSIYRAPRIMNVVLKRFGISASGCEKSKKEVSFPLSFSMSLQTSKQKRPVWITYDLYAVVCHLGRSLNMGHYITYIKGQHGFWSRFSDSSVTTVSQNTVLGLKQDAYLLFYAVKDECVQICDMLVNDDAITNMFTTAPVPANRNLETTIAEYRTDVLRAESVAEESDDLWPANVMNTTKYSSDCITGDEGDTVLGGTRSTKVNTLSVKSGVDRDNTLGSRTIVTNDTVLSGTRSTSLSVKSGVDRGATLSSTTGDHIGTTHDSTKRLCRLKRKHDTNSEQDILAKQLENTKDKWAQMGGLMNRPLAVEKRFVTRRQHGYRFKLLKLFRQQQEAEQAVGEIMRIKEQFIQKQNGLHEGDSQEVEVELDLPGLYDRDDEVETWSDTERDRHYRELCELIEPMLPKRSQEDIDYDRGKVKKKKSEPQRPLGTTQIVQHDSGAKIAVHQKSAFDILMQQRPNKFNGPRRGGSRGRPRRQR
ncbi:peptidase C19 family protein [Babesia ovis]|uniref:ubiquitinyl hydrolase 1 n=1 Tax=Babesia ovis TaxID=5869 RepID=A0A9W5TB57_BABOV|nr:peptidase C19 family protein [Babesia ovis]